MRIIKKPVFLRTDAPHLKDLEIKWKKPRGKHNKIRLGKKGKRLRPKIGYSNSKTLKNKIQNLIPVTIKNEKDISLINKEDNIAIISKSLGIKKRINIVRKLLDSNIKVANFPDLDDYYNKIEKTVEKRKETKYLKEQKKEKSREEIKKIQEKTQKEEKAKTEEQREKEQEEEKRRLLESAK
ncbi:hypothetical protein J4214_04000 [Candidatus Woesearchaeota archaeon]|nr:hypothetical protein [Candidatus Woesearchaeota archaeon]